MNDEEAIKLLQDEYSAEKPPSTGEAIRLLGFSDNKCKRLLKLAYPGYDYRKAYRHAECSMCNAVRYMPYKAQVGDCCREEYKEFCKSRDREQGRRKSSLKKNENKPPRICRICEKPTWNYKWCPECHRHQSNLVADLRGGVRL